MSWHMGRKEYHYPGYVGMMLILGFLWVESEQMLHLKVLWVESEQMLHLTAVPSKVLESLVRDKLLEHMQTSGLLHPAQHGFLPRRSCATQLLEVLEEWSSAADDGVPVDVAYFDFRKAFDTVPHKRLLHKLHAYGIRGKLLLWIEAFLTDRRQRVVVQGSSSDWAPVKQWNPSGISPGSHAVPHLRQRCTKRAARRSQDVRRRHQDVPSSSTAVYPSDFPS